ncbi:MAG: S1 RNA-binding domain-containing protein [Candidatus Micrarchaeota archaeon]|nr:S1 RNA-binding domain-containing protein [Candidatus Micrarchaeota archaeon]
MDAAARPLPKVGSLVIANVSKITKFGAYCRLPEYNDLEVFLPLREISSGWIKNIREFIHEGQKLVCLVSFYDKDKNTIDVSLKKVTPKNSKEKIRAYNLEKRLGALFAQAIKMSGERKDKDLISQKAIAEFQTYTNLMDHATNNTPEFVGSTMSKKLKESIIKVLEANKKQKHFIVSYILKLSTYNTLSGAAELRGIFSDVKRLGIDAKYIGSPRYRLVAEGDDYSQAEDKIKKASEIIREKLKKGEFEMEKEKLRKAKEDIMSAM